MSTPLPETLFVGSSELAGMMRRTNWSHTPLGSSDGWPQSIRAIIRMMLTSRYAMWMGWGPDLTFFYNDAYASMTLGAKHPWALGRPAREVWAEIWGDIGPRIEHVLATGEATWDEGLQLFLERSGFPEETYHTFSYSPLHQDDGQIAGMFCVVTEETDRLIGARRLGLLRRLGTELAATQTIEGVGLALGRSLESDARDFPFTLTYLFDAEGPALTLAATSGLAAADPIARRELGLDDALWPIGPTLAANSPPAVVTLPSTIAWPRGPWPKAPERAIVVPIPRQGGDQAAGVFIAALNPFRPLDGAYTSFISLYVGQLAAGLANAQAYSAERRRAEALAQIDRAKTTFFSNVSHELRTPLTLMLGPVTDALTGPEQALTGEPLALVYRNGLRLRKLVNALLDFSRIEAGRMEASYEPVDLGAYTAELASAFESAARRGGLRFSVHSDTAGTLTHVDRDMWEKIVLNLVSNAFKFTMEGEIAISVHQQDGAMVLRVRDTGIGIPASALPRVFERFHRVEGTRGRTQEGTGIGLALVKELVHLHGGTIDVDSVVDRGTTFTVSIPVGTSHLPPDRLVEARPRERSSLGADPFISEVERWMPDSSFGMAGDGAATGNELATGAAHIVLADDNADMRAYLGKLLGSQWHVTIAPDGVEALRLVRAQPPDLVMTDVMMPHLDGFGLLRELRADERTRHIPVMMLSARAGEESRIEGFEAGADDYLVKPFTARELVARVEAQLLRARVRRVEDEHRHRLASIFSNAPVAIVVLRGPTHIYELANAAYVELVGQRDLLGRPIREVLPELETQEVYTLLDRVYETGTPFIGRSYRIMLQRRPGAPLDECYFDFVYQPTFDRQGKVDGVVGVGFEVTALANARQAAEDANRAKDEFLAMLGHELRNPLAPILTALQLLRLRGVEGGERERTIIERQVRHLVGLVDDLLDVSRITRGKVRLNRAPIELNEVVARAIEIASPLLEQHQHTLEVSVARRGLGVDADPDRLAQVAGNLLTNAAKYTPPGGRVEVSAVAEGDQVVLRVRDTGIGIDRDVLPRIFDLFTQDRQAIDRAQGGLGLGLAIVRSLVALHGGSVTADSKGPGHGSEFAVRLPKIEVAARARVEEPTRPQARESGLRVLVVDDNEDAAMLLAEALEHRGHQTATAYDGPTALATAAAFRPDVALLDIGLPVMDGYEVARQFRADPALQRARLVAVTGYGQEHDRRRSAAAGFDAHLVKPVDLDEASSVVVELGSRTA